MRGAPVRGRGRAETALKPGPGCITQHNTTRRDAAQERRNDRVMMDGWMNGADDDRLWFACAVNGTHTYI